jgi:hypothetical protein
MDVQYPYAAPEARLQLLYRLPTAPAPRRLLVVGDDRLGIGGAWGASDVLVQPADGLEALAQRAPASRDAVALPAVLGAGCRPRALAAAAARLLAPGGVVIGHFDHGYAVRRLLRPAGLWAALAAAADGEAVTGSRSCARLLRRAGLVDTECFYVLPDIASPMALVPAEVRTARRHFLRATHASRMSYRPAGYALRLMLAQLGAGGAFQNQIFFWARKPC